MVDSPEIERRGVERVMLFSDAVFAIAATLLVISLDLPKVAADASDSTFNMAVAEFLPRVLVYALSFAIVGSYWAVHLVRFQSIERVDAPLVILNLLLLGVVAFIPWPTKIIGEHGDRPVAVVIYAVTLAVAGILGPISWAYASFAGLLGSNVSKGEVLVVAVSYLLGPFFLLASLLLLPFVGTGWVEASWLIVVFVQALLTQRMAAAFLHPG